jgi:UDP-glucose 4-epimerase
MARILVTGATGFIGRALIPSLVERGHTIRAAVRQTSRPSFGSDVTVISHPDFLQTINWAPLTEGIDVVIHLAGLAHESKLSPDLYDLNRIRTLELAKAAAQAKVQHFIFMSSIAAQCGSVATHTLNEADPALPTSLYGRSKLAVEEVLRGCGVPFTVLRPVLVYGRFAKGNFGTLLRATLSPWPLPLSNLTNRRSFLGIENLISAVTFVLEGQRASGETYIVADPGIALSIADVIATLRKALGRPPLLFPVPAPTLHLAFQLIGRGEDWKRISGSLLADPAKLIGAGWRPIYDTRTGLTMTIRSGHSLKNA